MCHECMKHKEKTLANLLIISENSYCTASLHTLHVFTLDNIHKCAHSIARSLQMHTVESETL